MKRHDSLETPKLTNFKDVRLSYNPSKIREILHSFDPNLTKHENFAIKIGMLLM